MKPKTSQSADTDLPQISDELAYIFLRGREPTEDEERRVNAERQAIHDYRREHPKVVNNPGHLKERPQAAIEKMIRTNAERRGRNIGGN